jgi:hypothetical protein
MGDRRRLKTENIDGNGDLDERARGWAGDRSLAQEAIKCASVTENRSKGGGGFYVIRLPSLHFTRLPSFHFIFLPSLVIH